MLSQATHQLLLPQLLASKLKPMPTLKPETRDRLHWRKLGFEKSHSRSVHPAPSGLLHEPVCPKTRPECHCRRHQQSAYYRAEKPILTASGTLVVVDSPFLSAFSWVKGPPVLVNDGVMVWAQLFLNVKTWSAIAGVAIAAATARTAVMRENMVRMVDEKVESGQKSWVKRLNGEAAECC